MNAPHPLYLAALQADAQLDARLCAYGVDRWTSTPAIDMLPDVRLAYHAKTNADADWLAFMRQDSEQRTARRMISPQGGHGFRRIGKCGRMSTLRVAGP